MSAAENFVGRKHLETYNMYQLYEGGVLSPFIPVVPLCGKMTADVNKKIWMFVKYSESQFNNIDNDDDAKKDDDIHRVREKGATLFLPVTLRNANRF